MSKLDEAFLKAYTKDRGAVTRSEPAVTASAPAEEIDNEIWIDGDGERVVRCDAGVLNVASFIARSAGSRPRGGAPGDGATGEAGADQATGGRFSSRSESQSAMPAPPSASSTARLSFEAAHSLGGPHFQPISLNLAAFDLFTQTDLLQSAPVTDAAAPVEAAPVEAAAAPTSTAKVLRVDTAAPVPTSPASGIESEPTAAAAAAPVQPSGPVTSVEPEPATASFQAAWEVDRYEFEEIVEELCGESSPLWEAARQLRIACSEGLKVLAVTSPLREQGRSTLAITLARMVATSGLSVLLVDGDIDRPALADKLSLEIQLGWDDALRADLPAEEVAVHSVTDRFTVLPLATSGADHEGRPAAEATTAMLKGLMAAFDLVIIDASNINSLGGWIPGADTPCLIDAALVIDDARSNDPSAPQACVRRLQKMGIENVGIVENFTD